MLDVRQLEISDAPKCGAELASVLDIRISIIAIIIGTEVRPV